MINLEPIAKSVQKRLFEKMRALGRETSYSDSPTGGLTQQEMMSRTTFVKMVSNQENPVILMGGELKQNGGLRGGYDEIYGSRGDNVNSDKRPMPGVKSIDVTFKGGTRALREATISWTCWSFEDLNRLIPHFLSHGKEVMIEWGWMYNEKSLLQLPTFISGNKIDKSAYKDYRNKIIEGRGDFDMMIGVVKNFEYTTRADGGFDCQTILSSVGVNLVTTTIPNDVLSDSGLTYRLPPKKKEPEKKKGIFSKLNPFSKEEEGGLIAKTNTEKDEDVIAVDLNMTLKTFIRGIDRYVGQQIWNTYDTAGEKYLKGKIDNKKMVSGYGKGKAKNLIWEPNCYMYLGGTSFDEMNLSKPEPTEVWVRWGWFEDNVLSKFTSLVSKEDIITEFRSLEYGTEKFEGTKEQNLLLYSKYPEMVGKSKEIRKKKWDEAKLKTEPDFYESTKIRNSKYLETIDYKSYILPGKYHPQKAATYTVKGEVRSRDKKLTLKGDADIHHKLKSVTDETSNFPKFDVDDNSDLGYFRNMLINTKVIKQAFGADDNEVTPESISLAEAMESMFRLLNLPIDYWSFELKQDELDTNRVKVVDDQISAIDFSRNIPSQKTIYDGINITNNGIFYFPVWKQNSIVKSQNLSAKVPDALQLQTMYGSSLNQFTAGNEPGGFGDKSGIIAGGLSNEDEDKRIGDLDFALRKQEEIGNENGFASEPLKKNGGKRHGVISFAIAQINGLRQALDDYRNRKNQESSVIGIVDPATYGYDASVPSPLLNYVEPGKRQKYWENLDYDMIEKVETLYGNKYIDSKMKGEFLKTISYMSTGNTFENVGHEKNIPILTPLELELEIDGTGGIYPGNSYHSSYLPENYQEKTVFQAFDVNHTISSTGWTTTISGKMRSTIGRVFRQIEDNDVLKDIFENYERQKNKDFTKGSVDIFGNEINSPGQPGNPGSKPKPKAVKGVQQTTTISESTIEGTAINAELGNNPTGGGARFVNNYGYATKKDLGTGTESELSVKEVESLGAERDNG